MWNCEWQKTFVINRCVNLLGMNYVVMMVLHWWWIQNHIYIYVSMRASWKIYDFTITPLSVLFYDENYLDETDMFFNWVNSNSIEINTKMFEWKCIDYELKLIKVWIKE